MKKRHWYDYLWIWAIIYFTLGFFNILFAWLGLIDFLVPLILAIFWKNKLFCNSFCGRGQLLTQLGSKWGLSFNRPTPKWLYSKVFRYGFLAFFMTMFIIMLFSTYLVFSGASDLHQTVTLIWTFKVPWHWAYHGTIIAPWVAQFAFGFYGVMLTSFILGLITMVLFKPRTWCTFCPMGSMTQAICKAHNLKK